MGLCTPRPHHLLKKVDENFNKIIFIQVFEVRTFFQKGLRRFPPSDNHFSTVCGLPCGKVMIFHQTFCGKFPKRIKFPLKTSRLGEWKIKSNPFWKSPFFDNPASSLCGRCGKTPPLCPVETRWKKSTFPIFARKTAKIGDKRQLFQNPQTAD